MSVVLIKESVGVSGNHQVSARAVSVSVGDVGSGSSVRVFA